MKNIINIRQFFTWFKHPKTFLNDASKFTFGDAFVRFLPYYLVIFLLFFLIGIISVRIQFGFSLRSNVMSFSSHIVQQIPQNTIFTVDENGFSMNQDHIDITFPSSLEKKWDVSNKSLLVIDPQIETVSIDSFQQHEAFCLVNKEYFGCLNNEEKEKEMKLFAFEDMLKNINDESEFYDASQGAVRISQPEIIELIEKVSSMVANKIPLLVGLMILGFLFLVMLFGIIISFLSAIVLRIYAFLFRLIGTKLFQRNICGLLPGGTQYYQYLVARFPVCIVLHYLLRAVGVEGLRTFFFIDIVVFILLLYLLDTQYKEQKGEDKETETKK